MQDFIPKKRALKNQTPRQIALLGSGLSTLLLAVLFATFKSIGWVLMTWKLIGLICLLNFVIDFYSNHLFIRHFIFRKIKLIYKVIHDHRLPQDFKENTIAMNSNLLDQVEAEVDEWAENQARDYQLREERATYRRKFIGDVSHELKTPIFNIQGFLHTLMDGAIDDPEVNKKYLERAASNADRLETIVEDLETINRLESGQMVLDLRVFDLKKLVQDVFDDTELKAESRNIRLLFKEGADQAYRVRADKEAIRQVLINFVTNSIKYGKEGGFVKVSFYDMAPKILVEVSDNGIGIGEEHLPHVFERFYRVDKSRSRNQGGTGLGLSIVKHIIEAHKETLNVRSDVGKGTTFGFTLSHSINE